MSLFSLVSPHVSVLLSVCLALSLGDVYNCSCLPLSLFFVGFLVFFFFNAFSSVFPTSSRTEVKQHVWQVAGSVAVDVAAAVAVVAVAVAVVVVVFSS